MRKALAALSIVAALIAGCAPQVSATFRARPAPRAGPGRYSGRALSDRPRAGRGGIPNRSRRFAACHFELHAVKELLDAIPAHTRKYSREHIGNKRSPGAIGHVQAILPFTTRNLK